MSGDQNVALNRPVSDPSDPEYVAPVVHAYRAIKGVAEQHYPSLSVTLRPAPVAEGENGDARAIVIEGRVKALEALTDAIVSRGAGDCIVPRRAGSPRLLFLLYHDTIATVVGDAIRALVPPVARTEPDRLKLSPTLLNGTKCTMYRVAEKGGRMRKVDAVLFRGILIAEMARHYSRPDGDEWLPGSSATFHNLPILAQTLFMARFDTGPGGKPVNALRVPIDESGDFLDFIEGEMEAALASEATWLRLATEGLEQVMAAFNAVHGAPSETDNISARGARTKPIAYARIESGFLCVAFRSPAALTGDRAAVQAAQRWLADGTYGRIVVDGGSEFYINLFPISCGGGGMGIVDEARSLAAASLYLFVADAYAGAGLDQFTRFNSMMTPQFGFLDISHRAEFKGGVSNADPNPDSVVVDLTIDTFIQETVLLRALSMAKIPMVDTSNRPRPWLIDGEHASDTRVAMDAAAAMQDMAAPLDQINRARSSSARFITIPVRYLPAAAVAIGKVMAQYVGATVHSTNLQPIFDTNLQPIVDGINWSDDQQPSWRPVLYVKTLCPERGVIHYGGHVIDAWRHDLCLTPGAESLDHEVISRVRGTYDGDGVVLDYVDWESTVSKKTPLDTAIVQAAIRRLCAATTFGLSGVAPQTLLAAIQGVREALGTRATITFETGHAFITMEVHDSGIRDAVHAGLVGAGWGWRGRRQGSSATALLSATYIIPAFNAASSPFWTIFSTVGSPGVPTAFSPEAALQAARSLIMEAVNRRQIEALGTLGVNPWSRTIDSAADLTMARDDEPHPVMAALADHWLLTLSVLMTVIFVSVLATRLVLGSDAAPPRLSDSSCSGSPDDLFCQAPHIATQARIHDNAAQPLLPRYPLPRAPTPGPG